MNDYTSIPQELIYENRKSLNDFARNSALNACLINNIREMLFQENCDINSLVLTCLNKSYYICTIAIMSGDTDISWSGIREISILSNSPDQEKIQEIILSLVIILLERKGFIDRPNISSLLWDIRKLINERHPYGSNDIYYTLHKNINDLPLPTDIFEPLCIFQALETANDSTIIRGIKYIEECIMRIQDPASIKYLVNLALSKFDGFGDSGEGFHVKSRLEFLRNNPNAIPQNTSYESEKPFRQHIAKLEAENAELKNKLAMSEKLLKEASDEKNKIEKKLQLLKDEKDILQKKWNEINEGWKSEDVDYEKLWRENKVTNHQRIVFFTTVFSIALNNETKGLYRLDQLALLISCLCNENPGTIGPMLSRIATTNGMIEKKEATEDDYSIIKTLGRAAQAVSDKLGLILRDTTMNDKTQMINKVRDNLSLNYPMSEND